MPVTPCGGGPVDAYGNCYSSQQPYPQAQPNYNPGQQQYAPQQNYSPNQQQYQPQQPYYDPNQPQQYGR